MPIIKKLRTSGGDFTTILDFMNFIESQLLLSGGIPDDIICYVQGGQSFGSHTVQNELTPAGTGNYNNKTITITTEPSEISTPAEIQGRIAFAIGDPTPGTFIMKDIIHTSTGIAFMVGAGASDQITFQYENVIVFYTAGSSYVNLSLAGANKPLRLRNCSIFLTNTDSPTHYGLDTNNTLLENCFIATFRDIGAPNLQLQDGDSGAGFIHKNNTFYNYGSGGVWTSTGYIGPTQSQIGPIFSNTPPALIGDPIITAFNESVLTMSTRNTKITIASVDVIDNAAPGVASLTDIIGVLRPQGAGFDRSAYEFSNPNTPPNINLKSQNQRPIDRIGNFNKSKVDLEYFLVDEQSNSISLTKDGTSPGYEFALAPDFFTGELSGTMSPDNMDPAHSGVSGLASAPTSSGGVEHKFVWDACKDIETLLGRTIVDVETFSVKIRLQAHDGTDPGGPTTSNKFNIRCGLRSPSSTKTKDIAQHFGRLNWR